MEIIIRKRNAQNPAAEAVEYVHHIHSKRRAFDGQRQPQFVSSKRVRNTEFNLGY